MDFPSLVRLGERRREERCIANLQTVQLSSCRVCNNAPVDAPAEVTANMIHDRGRVVVHPLGQTPATADHDQVQPAEHEDIVHRVRPEAPTKLDGAVYRDAVDVSHHGEPHRLSTPGSKRLRAVVCQVGPLQPLQLRL